MMDSDLLRREKEYHDLNKELELKTKELLQEVHHVMNQNKNDFTIHFDPGKYEIENDLCQRKSKSAITKKSDAFRVDEKDCKELNIPIDINNMGAKGLVHFLKAKAKQLQMDYDKLLIDYKQKCEEIKKLQRENGKHIEQKEKWLQSSSASKNTSAKLEQQKNILQYKLNARENETVSLKKEIDQLHKELKSLKSNTNSLDVRMTRIVEENDKLKNDLKTCKQEEKDLKEVHRKEVSKLTTSIRNIEKCKDELINGFKKQLLLIDNLKKQKVHIECLKLTEKCENDLMKILDWKVE